VRNHLVRLLTWRCASSSNIRGRRPGLRFRQVGKELEFGVHQQAAAPLPERQCVFEHWPDQLKRRSFIRVDACEPFSSARGRWLAFHKNTKGLRCPSFRSLRKSLDTCLGSRHGASSSRILQSHAGLLAAGPPKRGNSSPRQCHGLRQPRSWEVVFKTDRKKTPPIEILFLNMLSAAIVGETRKSL